MQAVGSYVRHLAVPAVLMLVAASCGGAAVPSASAGAAAKATASASTSGPGGGKSAALAKLVAGAEKEGSVIWEDALTDGEAAPVIKAFTQRYPGVTVKHTRIHDTSSRQRILQELKAGIGNEDVFDISSELVPTYLNAHVLATYDWTQAFSPQPQQLSSSFPGLIYVTASLKGIGINTHLLKVADAPHTWEGLLDPKWKDKLVVDSRPLTLIQLMPAWGEQKVLDFARKLAAQKPTFRRGQTESIQLMAAGEFPIIAGTYRNSLLQVQKTGAPVAYIQPDPVPVSLDFYGIPAKAPHPSAARLFLGWLATDGQKALDTATNRGIPLPGFDTASAKAVAGKQLSLFAGQWDERSSALEKEVVKALGAP